MKKHLAIMKKSAIEAVLSGQKRIETRFSQHKIAPFNQISSGDLIYMKPPGEEPVGQFRAKKIIFYDGLSEEDFDQIWQKYGDKIRVGDKAFDEEYEREKRNSFYGTLIFISESERFITSPIKIKKKDLRGWMVLERK